MIPMLQNPCLMTAAGEISSLPHTWNNLDGQDGGNNYSQGNWLVPEVVPPGQHLRQTYLFKIQCGQPGYGGLCEWFACRTSHRRLCGFYLRYYQFGYWPGRTTWLPLGLATMPRSGLPHFPGISISAEASRAARNYGSPVTS